jgi:hypothetical protein
VVSVELRGEDGGGGVGWDGCTGESGWGLVFIWARNNDDATGSVGFG